MVYLTTMIASYYLHYDKANAYVFGKDIMNILVTGNGFDIAHGLRTSYSDFLEFVNEFIGIYREVSNGKSLS